MEHWDKKKCPERLEVKYGIWDNQVCLVYGYRFIKSMAPSCKGITIVNDGLIPLVIKQLLNNVNTMKQSNV